MKKEELRRLIDEMKNIGIKFDAGLTDQEVELVEKRFGFQFPVDLRAFLQMALPVGEKFPNWRSDEFEKLKNWLDMPRQGVLFDVSQNNFWLEEWGPRLKSIEEAQKTANTLLKAAPILIPIYAHRMMPSEPNVSGNPVLSVHQTDIIPYGFNLQDYLKRDFNFGIREPFPEKIREIRFWNIDRFQEVRWGEDGSCEFDNSNGSLPEPKELNENNNKAQQPSATSNNSLKNQCHKLKKENEIKSLNKESIEKIKSIASIEEKILALIMSKFPNKNKSEIHQETGLINDLEMDSLDLAGVMMELEEFFDIDTDDYEPQYLVKISDIIKYVKSKTNNHKDQKYKKIGAVFLGLGSLFAFGAFNSSKDADIAEKTGAYLPCVICWLIGIYFFFRGKGKFF